MFNSKAQNACRHVIDLCVIYMSRSVVCLDKIVKGDTVRISQRRVQKRSLFSFMPPSYTTAMRDVFGSVRSVIKCAKQLLRVCPFRLA